MVGNVSRLHVNGLSKNCGSVSDCIASNVGTVNNESERISCYLLEARRRGMKSSSTMAGVRTEFWNEGLQNYEAEEEYMLMWQTRNVVMVRNYEVVSWTCYVVEIFHHPHHLEIKELRHQVAPFRRQVSSSVPLSSRCVFLILQTMSLFTPSRYM
jgi:hypothetical protein